ncbi:LOW QUALITY PROTEIN: sodium channel protein Nach [Drosophila nasuta]|uniref:LOW QUALITY PROTEIN: sodium channel protein Nach n=1 Tax=Drosophila nasuta TaxID=42062 RepID=UPI00295E32CD|nr:LOW QUALITY PROTEIN: sodium channel protein Nach [Drosophila nasuta]
MVRFGLVFSSWLKRCCTWIKHKSQLVLGVSFSVAQNVFRRLTDITAQAGAETSVLAIRLTVDRRLHFSERLLWLCVLIASIFAVYMLSEVQIARYFNSPTVISVDRDYRGWNGSLPAVTLCYYDHIDSFKANELIQDLWNVSIIDEDYFYIMDFLYAVVNATASNYAELTRFASDERFDQIDLYDIILGINRPFEQVISTFDSNFIVHVQMVMTERGSCYAINSPMSAVLGKDPVQYDELPPPLTCQYGKQQCYIRMDLFESTGVLDVHSPYEVSASEANIVALHKSDEITASFKVLETVASKNLRELSVEQRKCVFNDEETSNLKIYSKSLCLARCRAIMALEMCNCVPFFYPFVEGPSCNPAGFECLLDFKWPIWALHICKCPSTCTEIEYTMQTVKKSSWGIKNNEEAASAESATSSFRWDLIPPKVRFRRDVVFSFEDLIVSFGGVMALFVGISVMGAVQISYVIIYNCLLDTFKLIRFIHLNFHERCRRAIPAFRRRTSPSHVSRAETAELPLFEYVN